MASTLQDYIKTLKAPNRVFHHTKGKQPGPTVVFFAGIHGNEPAGINALNSVIPKLKSNNICGEVFGVYGNIRALELNKRFIEFDLNRLWTLEQIKLLEQESKPENEIFEQIKLYPFIKVIFT